MAFRRTCPRTLDRPVTFFGLEVEDLLALLALAGLLLFAVGAVAAIAAAGAAWLGLTRLKRGKPPGHLTALLYASRLPALLPFLAPPHLIRPDWGRDGRQHFSAVWGPGDARSPYARFYWPGERS
jgi:hypothetical protein